MPYQFKISGIDSNQNKSIWIDINESIKDDENDTFLNDECDFIRYIGDDFKKKNKEKRAT